MSKETNNVKFGSDLEGLINVEKAYQNNPLIAYLNINSLPEKIISFREIFKKMKIDVLCIDETKLDSSFTRHEPKIVGYQSQSLRREIETPREERKWFLFQEVLLQSK